MQESSVAFNLAELMRLEDQRVRHEVQREADARAASAAHRAALQARERAALEARLRAELEASDHALQEQARREQAREAALLRVRLELEAAERVERERLAQQHAIELERLRQPERRARLATWFSAALGALLAGCAALYLGVLGPALDAARALAAEAQALAAQRAQDVERLRRASLAAPAPANRNDGTSAATPGLAAHPTPTALPPTTPVKPGATKAGPRNPASTVRGTRSSSTLQTGLEDLDLTSDDPLEDLTERGADDAARSPRRGRARR